MGQVALRDSDYVRAPFVRYASRNIDTQIGDTVIALLIMDAPDAGVTPAGTVCRFNGSGSGTGTPMTAVGGDVLFAANQLYMRAWRLDNVSVAGSPLVEVDVVSGDRIPTLLVISAFDTSPLTSIAAVFDSLTGPNYSASVASTQVNDLVVRLGSFETNTTTLNLVGASSTTVVRQHQFAPGSENKAAILSKPGTASTTTLAATFTAYGASVHNGITFVLRGTTGTAPAITVQPANQSALVGGTATFNVSATGTGLTYQWRKNGVDIPGATSASYTTPPLILGDNGALFRVNIIGDTAPPVLSNEATLTVTASGNGTLTSSVLKNNAGTVLSARNFTAFVNNATSGALVVLKTGLTSNGAGIASFTDAALVVGQQYAIRWRDVAASQDGFELKTAT